MGSGVNYISGGGGESGVMGFSSSLLGLGLSPELTAVVSAISDKQSDNDKYRYDFEIKDFALQTSTYGRVIPEVFGKMRVAGNIMWSSGIAKTVSQSAVIRDKNGRIMGGGDRQVNYSTSLAIAICKGVVKNVTNIYADGVLLNKNNLDISIYLGSEDQLPNSIIQSHEGKENTPAFRGVCYVVLNNFLLNDYDGRVPNFTFDVLREAYERDFQNSVNGRIGGICIIPGTGEFVYDTAVQYKLDAIYSLGIVVGYSKGSAINSNNNSHDSDAVESVRQMKLDLPNLKWASVVCSWFGDSMNCGGCNLAPKVEYKNIKTTPDEWSVAGFSRDSAEQVSRDNLGNLRYGGTPSDASIVRYVTHLRENSIKVCFYPMMAMDIPGKPWRGRMSGDSTSVESFFNKPNGYRTFVLHYANLLRGKVDAFIIGSEMIGITKIKSNDGVYPAVDELCKLAQDVKAILGKDVLITYAADWSEYHHTDGGWYNLDKLWSHSAIDVIGIDAYFPLTNSAQSIYNLDEIKKGWESGEGWDIYYQDSINKKNPLPLSHAYAWKNIRYFWENEHYNPNGLKTEWVPRSKKIWFTEYGFPSVDCTTNQPNVFYSPTSQDSGFPYLSSGQVDFKAQQMAILATEEYWQNSDMVEQKFLWNWDARPYPYFPSLQEIWSDSSAWRYGHWVTGKLSFNRLEGIIRHINLTSGMKEDDFEIIGLDDYIDGFVINQQSDGMAIIKMLSEIYNFDISINEGKLRFSKNTSPAIPVDAGDIILINDKSSENIELKSTFALPSAIDMVFIDNSDYRLNTVSYGITKNTSKFTTKLPIAMSLSDAQKLAAKMIHNIQSSRATYSVTLPAEKYGKLAIGSTIYLISKKIHIKIFDIKLDSLMQNITISGQSISVALSTIKDFTPPIVQAAKILQGNTRLYIKEIPNYTNNSTSEIKILLAVDGVLDNWKGCDVFYKNLENEYTLLSSHSVQSITGKIISGFPTSSVALIDRQNKVRIFLNDTANIAPISEDSIGVQNMAFIGDELISFTNIEYISDQVIEISNIARGLYDTGVQEHSKDSEFVFLNSSVQTASLPISYCGRMTEFVCVTTGQRFEDAAKKHYMPRGDYLYLLKKIKDTRQFKQNNGDIIILWNNRSLANIAFWGDVNNNASVNLTITDDQGSVISEYRNIQGGNFNITKEMQLSIFGKEVYYVNVNLSHNL